MNDQKRERLKDIFDAALHRKPDERRRFIDQNCAGDETLRAEVESLLSSYESAESFMQGVALEEVADVLLDKNTLENGQNLGHYEIVEKIGAGGMGEVFLARDKKLDRPVAVKILSEKFSRHEINRSRFIQEAKAASALNHPNILTIYEIGETEDIHYIVSEYIEGRTLREIIAGSLPFRDVLDFSIQIANALAAAHRAGLVHRDVKPENIIIRPDGLLKILDFGLAKLVELNQSVGSFNEAAVKDNETAAGIIVGTVKYMSPEQAKGERVDARTDIFSLGVVIYEMIAGKTPFAADSKTEALANLIYADPAPLTDPLKAVPAALQRVIEQALRKKTHERYQTMEDLLTDLKSLRKRTDFETGTERNEIKATEQTEKKTNARAAPIDAQPDNSVAVLPFVNMTDDAENDYFCDGLAEELLNALSKIKDLKVAARSSAFSFKGKNTSVGDIAKALNVKNILEGSVRKAGKRLRVSAQLINASNGYQIWSQRFDGEIGDIFDLQDEITLSVIDKLRVKLLSGEENAFRDRHAVDVEAYQFYLKGRYHALKMTPPEIDKGIEYFRQAIEIEPNYARAHAGLAEAYMTFPLTSDLPPADFFPKAKAAAQKAVEIDPLHAAAHAVLAWILFWYDWDWNEAERQGKRAVALDPNGADGHEVYAHLLSNTGRHAEALVEIKRARELDPLHLRINALEGQFLLHAGQIDEGLMQLRKTLELEPNFWIARLFASSAFAEKEMFPEAVREAETARKLSGSLQPPAFGGYALAKFGKRAEAEKILAELSKLASARNVPAYYFAIIYNGLNDLDETFEWLEKAFDQRDPKMTFLKVEPKWNNLRMEPRFIALMKRMNF
jgi:eukaryotic-like serine/threonine-protein kinase